MSLGARRWCIVLIVGFALVMFGNIPIWQDDAQTRRNRELALELFEIGDPIETVTAKLRSAGFNPLYDSPRTATLAGDYLIQYFQVRKSGPNVFETLQYTIGAPWFPYTRKEKQYLILKMALDGTITSID